MIRQDNNLRSGERLEVGALDVRDDQPRPVVAVVDALDWRRRRHRAKAQHAAAVAALMMRANGLQGEKMVPEITANTRSRDSSLALMTKAAIHVAYSHLERMYSWNRPKVELVLN